MPGSLKPEDALAPNSEVPSLTAPELSIDREAVTQGTYDDSLIAETYARFSALANSTPMHAPDAADIARLSTATADAVGRAANRELDWTCSNPDFGATLHALKEGAQ